MFNNSKPAGNITSASDLFGKPAQPNTTSGASLFGQRQQLANNLFGANLAPPPAINLFGGKAQDQKKQAATNLFAAKPSPPVNIFKQNK